MKNQFKLLALGFSIFFFAGCKDANDYRNLGRQAIDAGNLEDAAIYFTKAAEKDDHESQYFLAGLYQRGWGVKQNFKRAFELYLQASKGGFKMANYPIGLMYYKGEYVKQNHLTAIKYFRADSEDPLSSYMIGKIYKDGGKGVKQNYSLALGYFIKTLKYNHQGSYREIAEMYKDGHISAKELTRSIELLKNIEYNVKTRKKLESLLTREDTKLILKK